MKILVTGGSGFLGKGIVKKLVSLNHEVSYISRNKAEGLENLNVQWFQGSISQYDKVDKALQGQEGVIHTAAKAGYWGEREPYYQTNVVGTENIIKACHKYGMSKLVFTSSPSVVFNGNDIKGADESIEVPDQHLCYYSETKALAEKLALAANDIKGLAVVSLRPHLIYGPGDNHLLPRIVKRAKEGALKIVGDGKNKVDVIYIDNAVDAHIKAFNELSLDHCMAGKPYFIADDEPVVLWEWVNQILKELDIQPVKKKVSKSLAYKVGHVLEILYRLFRIAGEPRMTRFVADSLSTDHYFNGEKAKKDWGYQTVIDPQASFSNTIAFLLKNKP